jgi:hypothetical protein
VWGGTSTRERAAYRRGVEARPRRSVTHGRHVPPTPEERARRALQRGASMRRA